MWVILIRPVHFNDLDHTGEVGNHFAQKLPELWFQGWFVILMVVSMVMAMATTVLVGRAQPQALSDSKIDIIQKGLVTTKPKTALMIENPQWIYHRTTLIISRLMIQLWFHKHQRTAFIEVIIILLQLIEDRALRLMIWVKFIITCQLLCTVVSF